MKVSLGICGALAALLLCGGCSTFRALFDEDPAVTQQKREKAKQRREARKRSGEEESDIFSAFSPRKRNDSLFLSSSLTPEERAVLETTKSRRSAGKTANARKKARTSYSAKASGTGSDPYRPHAPEHEDTAAFIVFPAIIRHLRLDGAATA